MNLRICCIWLVDSVESMMVHGLANPKHYFNLYEDSLIMAPTVCRSMWEEILCMCWVYIPVDVRLVSYLVIQCHFLNVFCGSLVG
jgi:hypothetical protein